MDEQVTPSAKKLSTEDKVREQNCIRQLAFKVRDKMPKDYKTFLLVAAHLVRNAHRYWKHEGETDAAHDLDDFSVKYEKDMKTDLEIKMTMKTEIKMESKEKTEVENFIGNATPCDKQF